MIRKSGTKGFTLIELLVVIAIIGILASVVLASLNSARRKSRDTRRIADLSQIKLALELYFDSNDTYVMATGLIDLETVGSCGATIRCMTQVPDDPLGTPYDFSSTQTTYCAGRTLEDDSNAALDNKAICTPSVSLDCTAGDANYCVSG